MPKSMKAEELAVFPKSWGCNIAIPLNFRVLPRASRARRTHRNPTPRSTSLEKHRKLEDVGYLGDLSPSTHGHLEKLTAPLRRVAYRGNRVSKFDQILFAQDA